jgi:hypothetical protein
MSNSVFSRAAGSYRLKTFVALIFSPGKCGEAKSWRHAGMRSRHGQSALPFVCAFPEFSLRCRPRLEKVSRMEIPEQVRELFRMQKALNERIGVQTEGMSDDEKTKWRLNHCRAMSPDTVNQDPALAMEP